MDTKVASNGRMVLPLSVRKAMGLHGHTKVIFTIENDQVRLAPVGHGISQAKALYREHAKHDRTTNDFCLALAIQLGVPAVTANRKWKRVKAKGLKMQHIR